MPAGADTAAGLAEPTVGVYADAERIMLERVARRLAKGLESPSWAEEKLAELQALRRELGGYMTVADREAEASLRQAIERAYRLGAQAAETDLAAESVAATAVTNTYTVGVLVGESMRILRSTYTQVLRHAEDAYRQVVASASMQVAAGTMTRREATQAALWRFADRGVTGFVDRSGRKWDLTAYTEMATRTSVGHASINGHLETLSANGHDLVIVSNAPGECEVCRPWEGRVLSIAGGSNAYPSIDKARADGLFHPGCRHSTGAYFPGVTEPYGPTADPEGYDDRTRLRYLERQVRASKLREATAISPEAAAQARARVRTYQTAIRQHVDETGLIRQRHREQISGTSRLNAGPTLPKPEPKPEPEKPAESSLPKWARGGAIEKAKAAFESDGGFLPLTDDNGRIRDDAWFTPGGSLIKSSRENEGWIRASGAPSRRALAHLDHVKAAGADIEAEIDRRTGGHFAKLDAATAKYEAAQIKVRRAIEVQEKIVAKQRQMSSSEWEDKYRAKYVVAKDKLARVNREWSETGQNLMAIRNAHPAAEIKSVIGELRPMGGTLNLKEIEGGRLVDAEHAGLSRAATFYPKSWLERSNAYATPLRLGAGSGDFAARGYYVHSSGAIVLPADRPTIAVHELGHRLEHTNIDVTKSEWAFWHSRTEGEETKPLTELERGSGYNEAERARKDKFSDAYMGKTYGDTPSTPYELMTMGMEHVEAGTYHVDADYRRWLFGMLGLV